MKFQKITRKYEKPHIFTTSASKLYLYFINMINSKKNSEKPQKTSKNYKNPFF